MSGGLKQIILQVASRLEITDTVDEYFRLFVKSAGISPDRADWIALSIREAVNNAILYGNKQDPSKTVEIEMEAGEEGGTAMIRIWDEGEGFDIGNLPDPTKEENLLRPHGRGIFLIRQFVDDVRFTCRNPKGFGIELLIIKGKS